MRILLITNSYPTRHSPSGAAYITERLAVFERMPEVDVTAVALVPHYGALTRRARAAFGLLDAGSLLVADGPAGHRYLQVPCRWSLLDVVRGRLHRTPVHALRSATRAALEVARDAGPFDVVHAHGMYTLPAGEVGRRVAASLDLPTVVSMHGSDVETVMAAHPAPARSTLRAAAATIYVSDALRRTAMRLGMPTAHTHVIPNGVDLTRFGIATTRHESPHAPDEMPQAERDHDGTDTTNPCPERPLRLAFVGNLLAVKGADRLPAIEASLRRRGIRTSFDIVGSGPLESALAARLPGARFHGRVDHDDVPALMRAADALLVPSRSEGWGVVITEAYATGTPVVAFDVGGIPEAVLPGEGLVPHPATLADEDAAIERFADAVVAVCTRPPSASAMRAHVAHRDWTHVARAELDVLRDAVTDHRRRR